MGDLRAHGRGRVNSYGSFVLTPLFFVLFFYCCVGYRY